MKKLEDKKEYNLKMKAYRDSIKFLNSYHCHNYRRRKHGHESISIDEFLEYRKFITTRIDGRLKASRKSILIQWEKHKKQNDLLFSNPVLKGNFTSKIRKKISKEFK